MEAFCKRMDLNYEIEFSAISFDLPERGLALLKSIHANVNPQFSIAATDMHVLGGNSLSDIRVRVFMFNRTAQIEVTMDRCTISFVNLLEDGHLTVCKTCISLIEKALKDVLTNVQFDAAIIKPIIYLELGRGESNASNYLTSLTTPNSRGSLDEIGSVTVHPGINIEVENEEERWNVILNAFRDRAEDSSLIVSCHALYSERGKIHGLESRSEHLKLLINAFLNNIGLDFSGFYSGV